VKVETFALERWMSTWEMRVEFDIAESGIYPMTTREIVDLLPERERAAALDELLDMRLGYTEARGTEALRTIIAGTYGATSADEILVTTGAIEANYLLFNSLLDPGDHIATIFPAYQQL
jgi:aspartate/methionine/tyrosine aminotransferase